MPIPTMYDLTLPILELLSNGNSHDSSALYNHIGQHFKLTATEINERTSGGRNRLAGRISWTRMELRNAGLLEYMDGGASRITERGRKVLADNPPRIDKPFLNQFEEYRDVLEKDNTEPERKFSDKLNEDTPEDNLKVAYDTIRSYLANEILEMVKKCSSSFFERLVVDVLVGMGYGGSREEAGKAIGGPGDGGIDGIINEDRLGLEVIYIQAKRWKDTVVGSPEIHKFVGALAGQRARKGVFITTSSFTQDARDFVRTVGTRIILVDGRQLADFMIDYNVGVTTEAVYELKRIDTAYFEDE